MSLTIDALASGQLAAWFERRPSFALMANTVPESLRF
jgi:hypothetical protein